MNGLPSLFFHPSTNASSATAPTNWYFGIESSETRCDQSLCLIYPLFKSAHMRIFADGSGLEGMLIKTTKSLGSIRCLWTSDLVLFFMCHGQMANESTLRTWRRHRLQGMAMPWRRLGQATSDISDGSVWSRVHAPRALSCALDIAVGSIELRGRSSSIYTGCGLTFVARGSLFL